MLRGHRATMKRLSRAMLVLAATVALPVGLELPAWRGSALAQGPDISAKEAFEAAKELGTVEAWNAFSKSYPTGFYADPARAYLKKLAENGS